MLIFQNLKINNDLNQKQNLVGLYFYNMHKFSEFQFS